MIEQRNVSRREFLRLVAIGAVGATVSACVTTVSPAAPAEETGLTEEVTAAEVVLRHMVWDQNQVPAVEAQAAKFQELNPNFTIEVQPVPWGQYWDKLWTSLAGGGAPDSFWLNMSNFKALVVKDALRNIQPYLNSDETQQQAWETNFDALKTAYRFNGEAYSWPRDYDTIGVALNLSLLEEAGLDFPPEADDFKAWDWAMIRSYAEQLTKQEGGRTTQFGIIANNTEQQGWFNWVYSNGGAYFNEDLSKCTINEPAAVEALREYVSYRRDELAPGAEALQSQEWTDMFYTGRVGMAIAGSWNLVFFNERIQDFEYDIVPIPYAPTGKSICMIHGLGDTIDKNAQDPDSSFKWISFLGSKEGSSILGSTGTVIPSRSDTAPLWFDPSFSPAHRDIYLKWTDRAIFRPNTAEPASSEWQKILIDEMTLVMEQGKDVQEAMDEACQNIDDLLAGGGV